MSTRKLLFVPLVVLCVAVSGCSSNVAPASSTSAPALTATSDTSSAPNGSAPINSAPDNSATTQTVGGASKSSTKMATNQKIVWSKTFEEAQAEAVKSHKPLMVDFYTDWCSACKMLDRDGYTNADVIQQSQKFVMVKVDAEKRQDLALRFNVTGYPTLLWLDADGKVLNTSPGYGGVEMLQNDMTTALHNFSTTV